MGFALSQGIERMSLDIELDEIKDAPPDTFGFSFVDMVSGGFGAAFFLFLVFATLPLDVGAPGGGGERFIQIWLTWPGGDNASVTFEPIVEYAASETTDWKSYRITGGQLRQTGHFVNMHYGTGAKAFWANVFGAGFSDAGGTTLRMADKEGSEWSGLWLHFSDPCPGRYRIRINRNAGFRELLFSHEAVSDNYPFTLTLDIASIERERLTIHSQLVSENNELAPLIALDSGTNDSSESYEFEINEPVIAGPDLDHCE